MVYREAFKVQSRDRAVSFHDVTDRVKEIVPIVFVAVRELQAVMDADAEFAAALIAQISQVVRRVTFGMSLFTVIFDMTGVTTAVRRLFLLLQQSCSNDVVSLLDKDMKKGVFFRAPRSTKKTLAALVAGLPERYAPRFSFIDQQSELLELLGENCVSLVESTMASNRRDVPVVKVNNKGKRQERLMDILNRNYANGDLDTKSLITLGILNSVTDPAQVTRAEALASDELRGAWLRARKYKGKKVKPEKVKKRTQLSAETSSGSLR